MNIPRVIVRSLFFRSIPLIVFALTIGCSRSPYHPDFTAYLRAEKELRMRVKLEVQLRDSLVVLQRTFGLDPQVELAKLHDHPESWIHLIEELRRAQ